MTKPSTTSAQASEIAKPIAPLWIFKLANPVVSVLLRSPLHRLLSGMLMLISYTGRKSGKVYTHPIGYFVWGDGELIAFSSARWWTNVRDGKPVTLLLQGQQVTATPTVIEEREAVLNTIEEFIKRLGTKKARMLPIGLPVDREPTHEDFINIPQGVALVHFKLLDGQAITVK